MELGMEVEMVLRQEYKSKHINKTPARGACEPLAESVAENTGRRQTNLQHSQEHRGRYRLVDRASGNTRTYPDNHGMPTCRVISAIPRRKETLNAAITNASLFRLSHLSDKGYHVGVPGCGKGSRSPLLSSKLMPTIGIIKLGFSVWPLSQPRKTASAQFGTLPVNPN